MRGGTRFHRSVRDHSDEPWEMVSVWTRPSSAETYIACVANTFYVRGAFVSTLKHGITNIVVYVRGVLVSTLKHKTANITFAEQLLH